MYILRLLGLFTLLFCLSSFTEGIQKNEKSTTVKVSAENTMIVSKKPKKKTYSPPKKGKTKVATTTTKGKKTPPKHRVAQQSAKKKSIGKSKKTVAAKGKAPIKGRAVASRNKNQKKYTPKKANQLYAENTAIAQENLDDDLEDEEILEEAEIIDNTDIALPSLSKSKVDTKQQKILLDTAFSYLGTPYRHGGVTRKGMDCSGFVSTTFKSIAVPLSRSSQEMATQGRKISLENVQVGDLLFFKTTKRNRISHVGMVVDIDGDVKFIHSSSKRGVVISSLSDAYYKKAFRMAKRVM
ncbi:NlpC/P60 family protein [uncultured Capnocytophaga sp.]|jgi:NLP/P60 protein|uniref:C40 family peptidase n=1 Tax=uncultured Capnocytophaga sp. TaxID=159273 RepID=UPI0028D071AC|nr:NlpC/P60 family protein [uncultured Capnocytophaga sp.]